MSNTDDWENILDELDKIPPQDPGWLQLEGFLQAVQDLATRKVGQRRLGEQARRLEQALQTLHPLLEEYADYFELKGWETWQAETCPPHLYEQARQSAELLSERLGHFISLENESRPTTRAARLKLDEERLELEASVLEACHGFQAIYADSGEHMAAEEMDGETDNEEEAGERWNEPYELDEEDHVAPADSDQEAQEVKAEIEVAVLEEAGIPEKLPILAEPTEEVAGTSETEVVDDQISGAVEPSPVVGQAEPETAPAEEILKPQSEIEAQLEPPDDAIPAEGVVADEEFAPEEDEQNFADEIREPENEESREQAAGEEEVVSPESVDLELNEDETPSEQEEATETPDRPVSTPSQTVSEELVYQNLAQFLLDKDLCRAYWLARGMELTDGGESTLPSWLLAVVQGSLWQQALWPDPSSNLMDSVRDLVQQNGHGRQLVGRRQTWLGLSAALYLSLADLEGGWEEWLFSLPDAPVTNQIIEKISNYTNQGLHLDPGQVQLILSAEENERRIQELATQAAEWLEHARDRGARMQRAYEVWNELIRHGKGDLYQWYQLVAQDQRTQARAVLQEVANWQNRVWVDKMIQKVDIRVAGRKVRPIQGEARDQMIRWISDACDIARSWAESIINTTEQTPEKDWSCRQIKDFSEQIVADLPKALEEISRLQSGVSDPFEAAVLEILGMSFRGYQKIFSLQTGAKGFYTDRPPYMKLGKRFSGRTSLVDNLAYPLISYPELSLDDSGMPDLQDAAHLLQVLTMSGSRSLDQIIASWIEKRDYRFLHILLSDASAGDIWEQRSHEAYSSELQKLEGETDQNDIAIEEALMEGLIAEAEHTAFKSTVESIRKLLRQNTLHLNIGELSSKLTDQRATLKHLRHERLVNQSNHWNELKPRLLKICNQDKGLATLVEKIVQDSLKQEDLRTANEYLVHLRDVDTGSQKFSKDLFHTQEQQDTLAEFRQVIPTLSELLETQPLPRIRDQIARGESLPRLLLPRLPKPRLEEAAQALDAWRQLKMPGAMSARQENFRHVEILMKYFGFILQSSGINRVSLVGHNEEVHNIQHWRVLATDPGSYSPVYQFGSERQGVYDVIGIWERLDFELISSQVLRLTNNQPAIILYFGRMPPRTWGDLLSIAHKKSLPLLVVDEVLIMFLVREYGVRLQSLYRCGLPFTGLDPYVPFAAGNVPPEVFFGREDWARKLYDPYGPAIVYGGRQLGKSALLRKVQREYHHPEKNQFIVYEDIKTIGDPMSGQDYQSALRDRLVAAFERPTERVNERLKLFDRAPLKLDRLLDALIQRVLETDSRVILLLDEADNFLEADAQKNFLILSKLKNGMDQTNRRFKVVLAGLHSVQQFQRISNQPLAHLGDALQIGPLEPNAARDLLEIPLRSLGYRFLDENGKDDPSLILYILSYTNYHPGLIQLFGHHLVEHVRSKYQQPAFPPFAITRADVEAVYRKKDVRDAICQRFNWTLALDDRYEAITLAMILEQWDEKNGFDHLYTPNELYDLASGYWKGAFDDTMPDRFKGFLQEMLGLGVLSEVDKGSRYRLRSPNLVHLMGSQDQVLERLVSLSSSTPPGKRSLESLHAPLDEDIYSPFTFGQEQLLNSSHSGVIMVFGSQATGYSDLESATQRLVPPETGKWESIRVVSESGNALQQKLAGFVKENSWARYLIAYRELHGSPDAMADQVTAAVQYCRKIRGQTLRVVFALDPQATWQWFQLPRNQRENIEQDLVEEIIPLKRWDILGIRQRLEHFKKHELDASNRVINRVLDATGGWPSLLDAFLERCNQPDIMPVLDRFRSDLTNQSSKTRADFLRSINILDSEPRQAIGQLLLKEHQEYLKIGLDDDIISLILNVVTPDEAWDMIEYLRRMAIVITEPHLGVEPVIRRLWNES